jgi:protein O-GlcNAc transferase
MLGRLISSLLRPPRSATALCADGAGLFSAQRFEEAASAFEQALLHEPGSVAAHAGLGVTLQRLGDSQRALPHLLVAANADPSARDLNLLVAQLLLQGGQAVEGQARLAALARSHPADAEVAYFLGVALRDAGDRDGALAHFRDFVQRYPEHAGGLEALAVLLRDAGFIDAALAAYARAADLRPDLASAASAVLFHEHYRVHDRAQLFRRHVEWGQRFAPGQPRSFPARSADPERRLTIGYVSADFNQSSAAAFIQPILDMHDRRAFRVACYSSSSRVDAVTARLRNAVELWCSIATMDDAAARERIEEDAVDILVDLNGHTRGGRLGLFGLRAAPVQVTYLGYGATTGVAAMDYRVTDTWLDPPGASENYYVERLVRPPESMWCFSPPPDAPAVGPLPAAAGNGITFASLNNFSKASDAALLSWACILELLPRSRLVLVGVPAGPARRRALDLFRARGVSESRLLCHERIGFAAFLDLHSEIDIALDPFPYTGGATTCNALWMGVPVLTLEGQAVFARSGSSILRAVGLEEWIASSPEDYVTRACRQAADLTALARVRASLRERVARSPLCDGAQFTAALESCYREMWRVWCRTRKQ